jgi:hypothetical protein
MVPGVEKGARAKMERNSSNQSSRKSRSRNQCPPTNLVEAIRAPFKPLGAINLSESRAS